MAKCDSWLKVSKEAKNNTAHTDHYSLCTYGQNYPSFVAYFKEIANTYRARLHTEETQLLNKNGDFEIWVTGG